jgi:hypothetical protein
MSYKDEVRRLMREARGESDADVALLEQAVRLADVQGDIPLAFEARIKLIHAATLSGNHEMSLVAFTWCLSQTEHDPQLALRQERRLLWYYKWIIHSLAEFSTVSRQQISKSFADMTERYRKAGVGSSALTKCRMQVAFCLGDEEEFRTNRQAWLAATHEPGVSDCAACELSAAVEYELYDGEFEAAVTGAQPLIEGRLSCSEVPCLTFGLLLLPLLRLGRTEMAEQLHQQSIRETLGSRVFIQSAGEHCAYLALVGKFTKAIEVFETGIGWVALTRRTWNRMHFLQHATVLFERLAAVDGAPTKLRVPKSLPFYRSDDTYDPAAMAGALDLMRAEFAAQFDQRNGNLIVSQRHQEFRRRLASIPPVRAPQASQAKD